MKTIIVMLFCAVAVALAHPPTSEEFEKIVEECKKEHAIPEAELEGLKMVNAPESEEGKCFVGCVLEKMGVVQDGKFSKKTAEMHAKKKMNGNPEELEKHLQLINKCNDEVGSHDDKCETGPKLMECIKTYAPGLGIILPGSEE
ncbi:general odorant-binding protein 56h [Anabrus simplex]|uniref:general odorant-binding protein 56h n=1 Tax=Anabrus simplex TaxID=316456 RepID=UPI0035A2B06D